MVSIIVQYWQDLRNFYDKNLESFSPKTEKEHADDLSIFYKDFLDKNFKVHLDYQRFVHFLKRLTLINAYIRADGLISQIDDAF